MFLSKLPSKLPHSKTLSAVQFNELSEGAELNHVEKLEKHPPDAKKKKKTFKKIFSDWKQGFSLFHHWRFSLPLWLKTDFSVKNLIHIRADGGDEKNKSGQQLRVICLSMEKILKTNKICMEK